MGLFLERARSNVFENDRAHSLIAVFVSRAIFLSEAARRLRSVLTFVNETGGVVKGIELSGSVAR